MYCPKCQTNTVSSTIHLLADTATCSNCQTTFHTPLFSAADLPKPPSGVTIEQQQEKIIICATTRSWLGVTLLAPFSFVFLGVSLALFGIFDALNINDSWTTLSLVPFFSIGSVLTSITFYFLIGKTTLTISNTQLTIFTGIGTLGHSTKIGLEDITTIQERRVRNNGGAITAVSVAINGSATQHFGRGLLPERIKYITKALALLVAEIKNGNTDLQSNLSQHLLDN